MGLITVSALVNAVWLNTFVYKHIYRITEIKDLERTATSEGCLRGSWIFFPSTEIRSVLSHIFPSQEFHSMALCHSIHIFQSLLTSLGSFLFFPLQFFDTDVESCVSK